MNCTRAATKASESVMPEITQCPQCQRKLNVEEAQLGQTVQCPVCGEEFTAAVAAQRAPSPPPVPEEREPPRRYDEPPPRGRDDDYERRRRPVRRGDYGDPYGGARPHRGGAVLAVGLIGLLLSCAFPVGWILGGIAVAMGNTDLAAMNRGQMDDSGRGLTQGGQVCGTIALVLSTLVFLGACLIQLGNLK